MEPSNSFLLKDLTAQDYDQLVTQVELERDGYTIYFVIDADLIGNYAFPKGINPEKTRKERSDKLNDDFIADEQLTLFAIFYLNFNYKKILLLDEYYFEIEGLLRKARKKGYDEITKIDPNLPVFSFKISDKVILEDFYNSFSQMYASVLFHINSIKKITNLIKDKKILLDSDNIENENIQHIIDDNRGSISNQRIIEQKMESILNKNLFESRKRDAIIIDRLIAINNETYRQYGDESKNLFILLSDSTLCKNTLSSVQVSLLKKRGKFQNLSLFRSVSQTFAYLVSLSYINQKNIDFNKTIENIKFLKDLSLDTVVFDKETLRREKEIEVNFNNLRNALENAGLLKSFDALYKLIKPVLEEKNLSEISTIFAELKKNSKKILKEVEDDYIKLLISLRRSGEFNKAFVTGIKKIESGSTFDLSKGADYIEGQYHHLPLLLTLSSSSDKYKKCLNELIMLILSRNSQNSGILVDKIRDLFVEMNTSKMFDPNDTDINIIKALVFLILPSKPSIGNINSNDILADDWLSELIIKEDNEAKNNLKYLQIWVKRRIKDYSSSIKIAEEAIRNNQNDPRFYHGLFLVQYCNYEETKESDTDHQYTENFIEDMISNLDQAYKLYPSFISKNYSDRIMAKSILNAMADSYFNSYSYCLTLKFIQSSKTKDELILNAYAIFNKLKDTDGKFRDELSEYYDTETFILYNKSFIRTIDEQISCLELSLEKITKALQLTSNPTLITKYLSRKYQIINRINELSGE